MERPSSVTLPPETSARPAPLPGAGADVRSGINNAFYESLGDRWYEAEDDPVALLRAEGRLKNPWVLERLAARFPGASCRVLDIGCGAGFLCNALARAGHRPEGVDLSRGSLAVARGRDTTGRAAWRVADAYRLPWRDARFDAVSCLDFLEHVERPGAVIAEAARVLKPGGLFFFHTFNRNPLAWLVVIKGLEWFVRNTPPRMHVLPLFIKPEELDRYCREAGMRAVEWTGMRPRPERLPFWRMLATGKVPADFEFRFTRSLAISYLGMAVKQGAPAP
jgi:2-polyprenyl-6-hydroxyphenyl methylase/3-demethylubiquinone-9 3-methyltransferase